MPTRAPLLISLFVFALLAAPAPTVFSSTTYKRCGDVEENGSLARKIRAKRISCHEARFVVRAFHGLSNAGDFEMDIRPNGRVRGVSYTYRRQRRHLRYDYERMGLEQLRNRLYNRARVIRWVTSIV